MEPVKSLNELIAQQMGVDTRPVVSNPSIGTTAERILSNNANRVALTFVNLSANTIYLMIDDGVSPTRGIRLDSGGGSASLTWQYDMHILLWEWWAIASGASSELLVIEERII